LDLQTDEGCTQIGPRNRRAESSSENLHNEKRINNQPAEMNYLLKFADQREAISSKSFVYLKICCALAARRMPKRRIDRRIRYRRIV
jgi:hypothetical protein